MLKKKTNRLSFFGPGASYEEPKIKAIDIAALLQEKYAFLSGAQAKNGCLFITMPEHPKFGSLSDRDTEKIFKYLVGLASREMLQKGFMLVLDRRKEKWGAVKSCLQKVQKCFPAKISIVCLLKPQGFFQKYSKPGFVTDGIIGDAKIQVVSLGSPSDLEGYIDKSMLTEELGGTLQYKHAEWVQFRTAIERFQRNLLSFDERMKKLRQTFLGTKLSSNIFEMEQTIETQEEMWQDVKEDIVSARQAGVTLLDCITVHRKCREDSDKFTPDVKANAAELKEALTQLEDLENNFSRFWKEHKLKIQYWLKVCLFEREMSQTTGLLLSALGNVSAMTDLGDSKEDAESLVNDVKKVAEKTTELLNKAKGLIAKGLKMIETNELSKDQIKQKCDEIKELCDKFDKAVEKREEDLNKAMDIHECLDMVNKWCKTGVDLLALQPIDRFQSSEGAEKALEEIDNFLKSPQGMNMIKVKKMTPASNALGNKTLINKVKDSMKRISEVNDMMMKRETSLKKLVVKRPVQPVSGVPANPPQPEESKRKISSTPKSPSVIPDGKRKFSMAPKSPTIKSPVMQPKERKKSTPPEPSTGRRPVSIVLDPESLQLKGSIQQSFSDPIIQTRDVVDGTTSPEAFKKRVQVMTELIETEKDYVKDMECIIKGYLKEFEQAGNKIQLSCMARKKSFLETLNRFMNFTRMTFYVTWNQAKSSHLLLGVFSL